MPFHLLSNALSHVGCNDGYWCCQCCVSVQQLRSQTHRHLLRSFFLLYVCQDLPFPSEELALMSLFASSYPSVDQSLACENLGSEGDLEKVRGVKLDFMNWCLSCYIIRTTTIPSIRINIVFILDFCLCVA